MRTVTCKPYSHFFSSLMAPQCCLCVSTGSVGLSDSIVEAPGWSQRWPHRAQLPSSHPARGKSFRASHSQPPLPIPPPPHPPPLLQGSQLPTHRLQISDPWRWKKCPLILMQLGRCLEITRENQKNIAQASCASEGN